MSALRSSFAAAAMCLALMPGAHGAVIQLKDLSVLLGAQAVTFDDVLGGASPGTNYDGVLSSGGATFAERFAGQVNSPSGNFDVLSETPSHPLALQVGAAGQNLVVFDGVTGNVMAGLGPLGFDESDAIGEGSIAVLFANDLAEFGFTLTGAGGGAATLDFFRRNGSLINRITLQNLANIDYGFGQEGGMEEIAGVSIFNDDGGGIGFDTFRYNVADIEPQPAPEPSTLTLLVLGVALLSLAGMRQWLGK